MTEKRKAEPQLTDAERHARFKDMAREVGASDDPNALDRALERLAEQKNQAKPKA